jgi:hypothetical protein
MENKMKKRLIAALALTAALLGSCAKNNVLATPTEFTYTVDTGAFRFKGVEHAETYTINVYEVLPDALAASLPTGETTKKEVVDYTVGEKTYHTWQCSIGSRASLKVGSDGYVSNRIIFYSYSASAMSGGSPIEATAIPLMNYVGVAMASKTDTYEASKPALITFRHAGTLTTPSNITYTISDEGVLTVSLNSYMTNCLTTYGIPSKISVTITKSDVAAGNTDVTDFNYATSVNGPNTAYNFDKASPTFSGFTKDEKDSIVVKVKAYGDGADILDSEEGTATYSEGGSSGH